MTQQNQQHEGKTKNDQQQEPVLSRDADVWPSDLSAQERELLRAGIVFLAVHHEEQRKQFAKDASNQSYRPTLRKKCRAIAEHHSETLHQIGELAARVGMRNGWPRTEAVVPFLAGTTSVVLAVDPSWSTPDTDSVATALPVSERREGTNG